MIAALTRVTQSINDCVYSKKQRGTSTMNTVKAIIKKAAVPVLSAVIGMSVGTHAFAADPTYKAAKDQSKANYDADKAHCESLSGNDKDVCLQKAKAVKTETKADAEAMHKTREAKKDAQEDRNAAEYKVAKEKCDALKGNEKDACVDRAKATYKQ